MSISESASNTLAMLVVIANAYDTFMHVSVASSSQCNFLDVSTCFLPKCCQGPLISGGTAQLVKYASQMGLDDNSKGTT